MVMLDQNHEIEIVEATTVVSDENQTIVEQVEANTTNESDEVKVQQSHDVVNVSETEVVIVESQNAFAPLGDPNDLRRHALMTDRHLNDQHPITAITGLRDELDEIKAIGTVYSDKRNLAEYYLWSDGNPNGEARLGRFVTICEDTNKIKVCSTGDEIFGITVEGAAFVGAEGDPSKNNDSYGLVARTGAIPVHCESDVTEGDYVVSNLYGVAKKSAVDYGLRVVTMTQIKGTWYAVVILGVSATQVDRIGNQLKDFNTRLSADEINITSAINVANAAYLKANGIDSSNTSVLERMEEGIEDMYVALDKVEGYDSQIQNAVTTAAQAKQIADDAVVKAQQTHKETVEELEDVMANVTTLTTDIEKAHIKSGYALSANIRDEQSMQSLVFGVANHSYGPYSQSYGLSLEEAASIIEKGYVYVPNTDHTEEWESYIFTAGHQETRDFTHGYYYEWDGAKWLESSSNNESGSGGVGFSPIEIVGNLTELIYWAPSEDIKEEDGETVKYIKDTLYKWEADEEGTYKWVPKAALQGNALCRSVTSINQTLNEVSIDVTNVKGDLASISVKVDENSSSIENLVTWKGDTGESLVEYLEEVGEGYAKASQIAQIKGDDGTVTAASIVAAVNKQDQNLESSVTINADQINLDGVTTFVRTDDAKAGTTEINGACIKTGVIQSDPYTPPLEGSVFSEAGTAFNLTDGVITSPAFSIDVNENGEYMAYFKEGATTGIIQSENYEHTEGNTYSQSGTQINLTDGSITAPCFSVDVDGKASFKGGLDVGSYIGVGDRGWKIDQNSLYHGETFSTASVWLCAEGSSENSKQSIGGSDEISGWVIKAGSNFGVTKTGALYCNNAHIKGEVTATSGDIGGWAIDSEGLYYYDNPDFILPDDTIYYKIGSPNSMFLIPGGSASSYVVGGSDYKNAGKDIWALTIGNSFGVLTNGTLYCQGGHLNSCIIDENCEIYGTLLSNKICNINYKFNDNWTVDSIIEYTHKSTSKGREGIFEINVLKNNQETSYLYMTSHENLGNYLEVGCRGVGSLSFYDQNQMINLGEEGLSNIHVQGTNIYLDTDTVHQRVASTITSDKNAKNSITDIGSQYEILFDTLRPVCYKYNDGTSDRYHTGFIAQEVDEAITKAGLTRQDFAALCISAGGTESELWRLRYEEFIALNTHEIQKLKARIAELEAKLG